MSHLPFTLFAYFLNSLSVLCNKFLLTKTIPDPLVFVFYISLVSIFAIILLPFTHIPKTDVLGLASFSTILWILGVYFLYKALIVGSVSRVVPIVGTFTPLILLIAASQTQAISDTQTLAVVFLVLGMVFIALPDLKGKLTKLELIFELVSAFLFAFSYLLLHQAFLRDSFFTVIVWSRLILLPVAICIFLNSNLRQKILSSKDKVLNPTRFSGLIFIAGQLTGMGSEILILFSISLANPSLVNSLQGTQYVFLLILALILAKKYPEVFNEKYSFWVLLCKCFGIFWISLGLYFLSI